MIETDRLILRRWRIGDAEALYRYASDERVSELALWPRHTSVMMSRDIIEKFFIPNPQTFAMVLRANNEPVGCIGLVPEGSEHHAVEIGIREIGYWIGHPYWNEGLTSEALNGFIEYCRDVLRLHALLITTDARNAASQRVAAKCGFEFVEDYEFEGIQNKAYRLRLKKNLSDMTLEELWQLFPIILSKPQPQWNEWAKDEIRNLSEILSKYYPVINHIGSTAIANIQAKPIIDILIEISPDANWQRIKDLLETAGYICMSSNGNRMSFNKGYTPDGYADKVFHVHIHAIGDNDEIIFRDHLNSHSDIALEYEALKLSLLPQFKNDRDGYTAAKTDFIKGVLYDAKNG